MYSLSPLCSNLLCSIKFYKKIKIKSKIKNTIKNNNDNIIKKNNTEYIQGSQCNNNK